MKTGPRNLITDVSGLMVGNAEDWSVKTGTTVVTAAVPFTAGVAVMGGAPGTRETDLLAPDKLVQAVDALVLSGGSAFGLDAASGVMGVLRASGRGHKVAGTSVPIVPGAILFDLANGGDKAWGESPYPALGAAACRAAGEDFSLGRAGAGAGAMTAGLMGGLGSASLILPGGACVGALVAVNALGSAVVPGGTHFWAAPFEMDDEFGGLGPQPKAPALAATFRTKAEAQKAGQNTTIAIVATDAVLSQAEATRMAWAAHDGLARALVPAHTLLDGDLVFTASTGTRALSEPVRDSAMLGHGASICLARAIARGVYEARGRADDPFPCWQDLAST